MVLGRAIVAHTAYARQGASGGFSTSIYITSPDAPDADGAAPKLIAANAAFPYWVPNASQLYFLGDRDAQGFYTKILRWEPGRGKTGGGARRRARDGDAVGRGQQRAADIDLARARQQTGFAGARGNLERDRQQAHQSGTLGDLGGPALSANGKVLILEGTG